METSSLLDQQRQSTFSQAENGRSGGFKENSEDQILVDTVVTNYY